MIRSRMGTVDLVPSMRGLKPVAQGQCQGPLPTHPGRGRFGLLTVGSHAQTGNAQEVARLPRHRDLEGGGGDR
jgi:hypothetical protein